MQPHAGNIPAPTSPPSPSTALTVPCDEAVQLAASVPEQQHGAAAAAALVLEAPPAALAAQGIAKIAGGNGEECPAYSATEGGGGVRPRVIDVTASGRAMPPPVAAAVPVAAGPAGAGAGRAPLTAHQQIRLTLAMPFLVMYWCLSHAAAWLLTLMVIPSYFLAQRLYWACPFIPHIWAHMGPVRGWAVRIGFEASYSINTFTRLLTLPLRPALPDFYILGFPKCGTTALAEHLKQHPAISGVDGLPYHEALSKESHYFAGVLGRHHASSAALYRSFFPSVITRWWCEVVRRSGRWMCFDACPVHACLPYTAARIARVTPNAKLIVMLRDPVSGVFSAEIMLRDMGVRLPWTLMDQVAPQQEREDPRFKVPKDVSRLWSSMAQLRPEEPLPDAMPEALYMNLGAVLQCGKYAELLQPFLDQFPRQNIMFINFQDWVSDTEGMVRQVLDFVGADASRYSHVTRRTAMQNDYRGRKMHPTVRAALTGFFAEHNRRMALLVGRNDLGWAGTEGA